MSSDGEGRRPWHKDQDPLHRQRVVDKIVMSLAQVYKGRLDSGEDLRRVAAKYENETFNAANSKEEYIRIISNELVNLHDKRKQVQGAASELQQQIQMGCRAQPVNAVQAIHGGNSSMSQVASTTPTHGRQFSQMQSVPMTSQASGLVSNQHMAYPFVPNIHSMVKQEQPEVTGNPHQILYSRQASVMPSASGVQHNEQMAQSVATQNSQQFSDRQMQLANFIGCNPESVVPPLVQPNGQHNPRLRQNIRGTDQIVVNQQGSGFNQQQMDREKSQMLVFQQPNVSNRMHNDHPGAQNSQQNPGITVGLQPMLQVRQHIKMEPQPMARPQQLTTVSQQNSSLCTVAQTSATMGSAGEVDWREEMFQQIKRLKDSYLSELMELNQVVIVPDITEKQLESLPKYKAEKYRSNIYMKKKITMLVKFLMLQKSNIPECVRGQFSKFVNSIQDLIGSYRKSKDQKVEMDARHKSQISHGRPQPAPSGGSASHQKQQEQPVVSQSRENTVTTAAPQQIQSNRLLGVASSCLPEKSTRSLQSLPSHKLQECCRSSPVAKSGVAKVSSPSASLNPTSPSPGAKLGAVKAKASPSTSVKSTFPSLVAKPGVVEVSTPSTPVKSVLPSPSAENASVQAASPCASSESKLPSPLAQCAVIEAVSPHALVKSILLSPVTNSGLSPVASMRSSVKPTSSDNVKSVSALLLEDNSAAAAPAAAQAVIGGATAVEENDSKQVTCTKPDMPATPLEAQTADSPEGDKNHGLAEIQVAKKPIDRLLDALRTSSPATLRRTANSLFSVVSMNDFEPHRQMDVFQNRSFLSHQGGSSTSNKLKRSFESMSSYSESPPLGCMAFDCAASEIESIAERRAKMQKTQNAEDALSEEITSANNMLFDTVISIADDNTSADGITSSNGGRLIRFSYTGMSLGPDLEVLFATTGMSIVMPVKLMVPADYPRSSPVIVCGLGDEHLRTKFSDISGAATTAFRRALYVLPEPMSVRDMAKAWDQSVRRAVVEFAQQHGGGTFSSTYGQWETC